jgi:hypothetical protein
VLANITTTMTISDLTIPFRIATYKVNYHSASSSCEGLKERIQRDDATDLWCLQGSNLSKTLKSLSVPY